MDVDTEDEHFFITSAVGLITGLSFYKLINSQWGIQKNKKTISLIQKAKIKSVDEPVVDKETVILKVRYFIS